MELLPVEDFSEIQIKICKFTRINTASRFLIQTECTTLEPSRSWINGVLEELQLELKKTVYIDGVRERRLFITQAC